MRMPAWPLSAKSVEMRFGRWLQFNRSENTLFLSNHGDADLGDASIFIWTDFDHHVPAVRIVPGGEKPAVLPASTRLFSHADLCELPLVEINDLLGWILGLEDECRSVVLWSRFRVSRNPGGQRIRIRSLTCNGPHCHDCAQNRSNRA